MITKLTRHESHTVSIHLTQPGSRHHAALRCVNCCVHIQWLSPQDVELIQGKNDEQKTAQL